MAALTASSARRRNVSPTSSTLKVQTRDVDCSGMTFDPEDGEFIPQDGLPNGGVTYVGDAHSNVSAASANAVSLSMVWGSAQRSDRQALGRSRVPTLAIGGIEVECQLFDCDDGSTLASQFPVGSMLSVRAQTGAIAAVNGDLAANNRLVMCPFVEGQVGWAIGYVVSTNATSTNAAAGDTITAYLYDKPIYHGNTE